MMPTWVLGGELRSALFAPPLFSLLFAPPLLVAVSLTSVALPELTFLPLDGFGARVSSELWLQGRGASPDGVTLPAGLITL